MAYITTSDMSSSVRAQYLNEYLKGAAQRRVYDAYATPIGKEAGADFVGTSYVIPFLNPLAPTETVISQTSDITGQAMSDGSTSVTITSFGDGVVVSELMEMSAFTNFNSTLGGYYYEVGQAAMASLELLAKKTCLNGTWVVRSAARASLNAGTSDLTYDLLVRDGMRLKNTKGQWFPGTTINAPLATAHSWLAKDLISATSQPLLAISEYQDKSYIINNEVGMLGGVRLSFTEFAHVFWGAGLTNTTDVTTTISAAVKAGDKTVDLTTVGSLAAGMHLTIGTVETSSTLYPQTEYVEVASVASSTATIIGEGPGGGFKFPHAILSGATNADSAFPILYGGANSMGKIYAANKHGPAGMLLEPEVDGFLKQWIKLGYKYYGGYGIVSQNRLMRREVSSSMES